MRLPLASTATFRRPMTSRRRRLYFWLFRRFTGSHDHDDYEFQRSIGLVARGLHALTFGIAMFLELSELMAGMEIPVNIDIIDAFTLGRADGRQLPAGDSKAGVSMRQPSPQRFTLTAVAFLTAAQEIFFGAFSTTDLLAK